MQNPPKRWKIFTSKKGCEDVYGFPKKFPVILPENDGGNGGGGVEVPVEKMRVERSVWENEKKERKEVKWKSRPRDSGGARILV